MTVKTKDAARRRSASAGVRWGPGAGRAGGAAEPGGPGGAGEGRPGGGAAGVAGGVRAGSVAGSGRAAAGAGQEPGAGAAADPAWADAGVAVHVLPGGGAADGGRPGHHPHVGAAGAAVRGCAPGQFRRVRLPRAAAGVRRQRFRRDAAWPVRVGCQAAGGQPGRGRAGQRVSRQGPPQGHPGGGREVPHGDAGVRRPAVPGGLVRAPGRRGHHRPVPVAAEKEEAQGHREDGGQGAHLRQHEGAAQADHRDRRAAADHQRPAADRAGRGGLRRRAGQCDL